MLEGISWKTISSRWRGKKTRSSSLTNSVCWIFSDDLLCEKVWEIQIILVILKILPVCFFILARRFPTSSKIVFFYAKNPFYKIIAFSSSVIFCWTIFPAEVFETQFKVLYTGSLSMKSPYLGQKCLKTFFFVPYYLLQSQTTSFCRGFLAKDTLKVIYIHQIWSVFCQHCYYIQEEKTENGSHSHTRRTLVLYSVSCSWGQETFGCVFCRQNVVLRPFLVSQKFCHSSLFWDSCIWKLPKLMMK